jgi:acetyltransferase-like isoleucine patch superfamily enzyme
MTFADNRTHRALKRPIEAVAALAVLPAVAAFRVGGFFLPPRRIFPGFSQAFSLLPGFSGVYLRRAFYRSVLPRFDEGARISFGSVFSHATVSIGRRVYIGIGCMIGDVTFEDDVLVGSHVSIMNGNQQHGTSRLDIPIRDQPGQYPRVTIGEDSWIGDRAIVMADVGKHCVVGAGSVVTKPVPDYAIVVGNPARIQGYREQPQPDADQLIDVPTQLSGTPEPSASVMTT